MNAPNQQIQQRPPEQQLVQMLQKMTPELARALPKHVSPERMARIALTALRTNAALGKCSPGSFLGSVLSAAQLGLEVNTPLGHAYLIPYKGECTLQIGYQGMMELARRSGSVTAIYAYDVREGDDFHYALGLNPTVHHVPSDDVARENREMTHVYAVAKLKDGEPVFTVLSRAQVDKARNRSMAKGSGPWVTDYVAMALKTAIRRLYKWLPKSAEMATAASIDESIERAQPQSQAWDPTITEALASQGVAIPDNVPTEEVDPETGEVVPPPAIATNVDQAAEALAEKHLARSKSKQREMGEEG